MRLFTCLTVLVLLTGCQSPRFSCYSRYHTQRDLASYQVKTPDPRLESVNYLGQSLYFEWFVPKECLQEGPCTIDVYVRLWNLQEQWFSIPINCPSGHTSWYLMGYDWYCSGGIFTYYACLTCNGQVLQQVTHPLYTELIHCDD